MSSPTQRTLQLLRDAGYLAAVVEKHNTFSRKKADLFGFADIIAIRPIHPMRLLVQCTSGAHLAERCHKMENEPNVRLASMCGFQVWAIGWKRYAKPIDRKFWRPTFRLHMPENKFFGVNTKYEQDTFGSQIKEKKQA